MANIYRLILETAPTGADRFATGATYPGCTRIATPEACDPQGFDTLQEAIDYAVSKNEIPTLVTSVEQVDGILDGSIMITDDMILSSGGGFFSNIPTPLLIGGGVLAVMLLTSGKRSRKSESATVA